MQLFEKEVTIIDYNPLKDSPGFWLSQTYRKVSYLTSLHFQPYGVTPEQWLVLMCSVNHPDLSQTQIADLTSKDKTTITRILDALEVKQMIKRSPSRADRRATVVVPTTLGRETAKALCDVERQVMEDVFGSAFANDLLEWKEKFYQIQAIVDDRIQAWKQHS